MNGLLTDLYELTMAAGYFEAGKSAEWGTFELSIRRLPKNRQTLRVAFDDGRTFDLSAELLRVTSPSAEVQGHSEAERKTVGGKRNVTILSVDPVGNYAIRIGFDDMHSTGIYSWAFLRDLGVNAEQRFQEYLDDLQAKGLDRDRPGVR